MSQVTFVTSHHQKEADNFPDVTGKGVEVKRFPYSTAKSTQTKKNSLVQEENVLLNQVALVEHKNPFFELDSIAASGDQEQYTYCNLSEVNNLCNTCFETSCICKNRLSDCNLSEVNNLCNTCFETSCICKNRLSGFECLLEESSVCCPCSETTDTYESLSLYSKKISEVNPLHVKEIPTVIKNIFPICYSEDENTHKKNFENTSASENGLKEKEYSTYHMKHQPFLPYKYKNQEGICENFYQKENAIAPKLPSQCIFDPVKESEYDKTENIYQNISEPTNSLLSEQESIKLPQHDHSKHFLKLHHKQINAYFSKQNLSLPLQNDDMDGLLSNKYEKLLQPSSGKSQLDAAYKKTINLAKRSQFSVLKKSKINSATLNSKQKLKQRLLNELKINKSFLSLVNNTQFHFIDYDSLRKRNLSFFNNKKPERLYSSSSLLTNIDTKKQDLLQTPELKIDLKNQLKSTINESEKLLVLKNIDSVGIHSSNSDFSLPSYTLSSIYSEISSYDGFDCVESSGNQNFKKNNTDSSNIGIDTKKNTYFPIVVNKKLGREKIQTENNEYLQFGRKVNALKKTHKLNDKQLHHKPSSSSNSDQNTSEKVLSTVKSLCYSDKPNEKNKNCDKISLKFDLFFGEKLEQNLFTKSVCLDKNSISNDVLTKSCNEKKQQLLDSSIKPQTCNDDLNRKNYLKKTTSVTKLIEKDQNKPVVAITYSIPNFPQHNKDSTLLVKPRKLFC